MLVAGGIGAETDTLHPGREEREGVKEDAELFVSGRDIAVPELRMEDTSEFGPVGVQGLISLVSLVGEERLLLAGLYEGRVHVEGSVGEGVLLMDGSDKISIDPFKRSVKGGITAFPSTRG